MKPRSRRWRDFRRSRRYQVPIVHPYTQRLFQAVLEELDCPYAQEWAEALKKGK